MKYLLLSFFVALSYHGYTQVTVNLTRPYTSRIYHEENTLGISGTVTSTYSIVSFKVDIDGTPIDVKLNTNGSFIEGVSLTGFPEDTLKVTAVATDAFGNIGRDTVNFVYNNLPKVTIIEPKANFAATPYLHVNLKNIDIDSCTLQISMAQNELVLINTKIKDSFETDLLIPDVAGPFYKTGIVIKVTDNLNQVVVNNISTHLIIPQNNPHLKLLYKGNKEIMDFKDSLVFVTTNNGIYGNNPGIVNIYSLKEKGITGNFEQITNFGILTPQGAVFGNNRKEDFYTYGTPKEQVLYDWNRDSLITLYDEKTSNPNNPYFYNIKAAGNFLCWSNYYQQLNFRNLFTKETAILELNPSEPDSSYDIASNGLLIYENYQRLETYKDGATKPFGVPLNISTYKNITPITDGISTAFKKTALYNNKNDSAFLFDGSNYIFLAEYKTKFKYPYEYYNAPYYDVNNGYTAFLQEDAALNFQVHLRKPSGITKQLTYGGVPGIRNYIRNLSSNGDVAISYHDTLFLNQLDDTLRFVFQDRGKIYFENNKKYFVIGNAIFEIDYGIVLPLTLTNFSAKRTGKTNLLQWSTTQELNTEHFEIQRSNNSRDFISIGTVKSFNNGKSQNDYTYTDQLPLKSTNYYRLKMIDKDGKFTYSAIRNVNNTGSLDVNIYPNPVNDVLTLSFNTEKITDVQIDITYINGKKLQSKKVQLPYGASIQTLNVEALNKGTYFVQCTTKDENIGIKFVKQ